MSLLPITLECPIREYAWGQPASASRIAQLVPDGSIVPPRCAELWIGAHPSCPAIATFGATGGETVFQPLDEVISELSVAVLGAPAVQRFGAQLPFLLKVLSIAKPLSIQVHPDRSEAHRLHAAEPQHYPDPNHKPELAVAIGEVEFLYGFRSISELKEVLARTPELTELLGPQLAQAVSQHSDAQAEAELLASLYAQVMQTDSAKLEPLCRTLFARLRGLPARQRDEQWIVDLESDYPDGDVGLFCFYLQNIERLRPGEAVFIGPNIPHAYLNGELVECMASSDNVVRAGLTPKFKDVQTLLRITDYRTRHATAVTVESLPAVPSARRFRTPATEFDLVSFPEAFPETCLKSDALGSGSSVVGDSLDSVELLFSLTAVGVVNVADGPSYSLTPGSALLIPAECREYSVALETGGLFRVTVPWS